MLTESKSPSVLLIADHAMALADAVASLGGAIRVRWATSGADAVEPADVVVLEQTMTSASPERIARVASQVPGAPIVSVVAEGRGRYSWVRVRQTGALYQIEASGRGSLADAVQMATGLASPNAAVDVAEPLAR